MTAILTSTALCPPGPPSQGWIAFADGVIVDMGRVPPPIDTHDSVQDLGDALITPGFIDLQCNGVAGDDLATADDAGWRRAAASLAQHGTTAYCGTLVSAALDSYEVPLARAEALQASRAASGAALLGVHLEGPFLGGAPGAHDAALLLDADVAWIRALLEHRPGLVRIVTLAPEADPGFAATRLLTDAGVVVALGHSRATYDQARDAADAGARMVTHLFNGMGPLHHREPGLVGAALDDDRLTPTIIADGIHVHAAVLRLTLARKANVVVVSDAVATTTGVVARDGGAFLADGTLAGATSLLDSSVSTLVRAGVAIERAVEVVTTAPARLLGLDDRGRLAVGARADIVASDVETLLPRAVWIGGVPVADVGLRP
ncbi:MAG: amidohydrolase family protein [Acidimicrobiia bacterium]|nr:amidohydrolase family protein [Acidimicrobiia bacterium]